MITSLHFGHKLASEIPLSNGSSFQEYISARDHSLLIVGLSERFHLVSTDGNQVLSLFTKLNESKGAGLAGISIWLILDCTEFSYC